MELAAKFTKQQMEQRDMFERREKEGKPVYLHEFLYPLLVGYDSVVLDVDCEIGGNDQFFNMLAGRTLQEAYGKREKFVLTTRLIEGTDGRKMSKTYGNCVYLDEPPREMFGKLMSLNDQLMATYFECCTDVSAEDAKQILSGPPREAKVVLAKEIVTLYHGGSAAAEAAAEFDAIFREKGTPADVLSVTVKAGTPLLDVLIEHKLIASKSDARRLIDQGGIKMNETPVTSVDASAEPGIVKVGKRKFLRVELS
jgi:tyrosyl-tRNA synthetase